MARIAVAVSGGVDSLCALCRLRAEGHDLVALHGLFLPDNAATAGASLPPGGRSLFPAPHAPDAPRLWRVPPEARPEAPRPGPEIPLLAPSSDDALHALSPALPGLRDACRRLGIALYLLDARERFAAQVIGPFIRAYAQGHTPNPCALCNAAIKFGALHEAAARLRVDALATGHYARLAPHPLSGQLLLAPATDSRKDQGYFLGLVPPAALQRAVFPLAGLTKPQCAAAVAAAGLNVPLPGESQEICFIPPTDDAYRDFLLRHWAAENIPPPPSGPVILQTPDGETPLATHDGLWRYTEGQRRGLGIAHSEPLYVLAKDTRRNALIVGPRAALSMRGCRTAPANLFLSAALPRPDSNSEGLPPLPLRVRLRYRQQPVPATVRRLPDNSLHITLAPDAAPHFPSAPGQLAAVYDAHGFLLAAAVIREIF